MRIHGQIISNIVSLLNLLRNAVSIKINHLINFPSSSSTKSYLKVKLNFRKTQEIQTISAALFTLPSPTFFLFQSPNNNSSYSNREYTENVKRAAAFYRNKTTHV